VTQRNLSEAGRAQSRALGEWLRAERIPLGEVRSSQWCRCVDTAELAFGGEFAIQPWPALNSFFGDRGREPMQREAALADLQRKLAGNRVWVTHQVNITSLTGVFPAMGEVVVARPVPGGLEFVGRLRPG
ncbi:MAG: histidine phosphatase family protein, partial [Rhodocyclaceae bacterium]|nr:histidine phosphatase family protein [Rhodocyclaceae bacterium]